MSYAEQNKKWLADKSAEAGVVKGPEGLFYKVLQQGPGGAKPTPTQTVEVHYEGKLINGKVFDSSYARGQPISFGLNQVIKGWTIGVGLMSPGDIFELYIPQEIAYGSQNVGGNLIPGYSTLIFKVELLKIK